ncbi:peptidase A24 [Desulfosporosinus sp. HMP52]|uniref:prepilin peptidase n=1 Tax=Desulfosporosinus sp. HMP52 TaxID=1487923 RepID=UPI00051FE118|nr:A24 family peptidase [Desulfosporosinus sp. HMP52]KGK86355.1 peptidase A24 [Desulfosporosinus sp. HMP52]
MKDFDFIYIVIFLVGLSLSRILNICIQRIPLNQGNITRRYYWVELISGFVPVFLFSKYGLSPDFAAFTFLMYILIIIFFIDLEHQIIPNELVIIAMFGGTVVFIYNLFRPFLIYSDHLWWNPLLGMVSGSGFLLAVSFFGSLLYKTEEVMGMGDVKLFAPIGLFLGWRMTLLALFISVVLGGMISLLLILLGKATRKSTIPFGPFIVIGVFITVMWGWDIAYWYLHNFWYY